ncbi:MAG TPA: hypothetical protein VFQ26_04900 [Nitrospiraceae bacterium]|nr:hypothetical protein [Nitrospiraceae bacterium]
MKITELTEREMMGITAQAKRDTAAEDVDPVAWLTERVAKQVEEMAASAEAVQPPTLPTHPNPPTTTTTDVHPNRP